MSLINNIINYEEIIESLKKYLSENELTFDLIDEDRQIQVDIHNFGDLTDQLDSIINDDKEYSSNLKKYFKDSIIEISKLTDYITKKFENITDISSDIDIIATDYKNFYNKVKEWKKIEEEKEPEKNVTVEHFKMEIKDIGEEFSYKYIVPRDMFVQSIDIILNSNEDSVGDILNVYLYPIHAINDVHFVIDGLQIKNVSETKTFKLKLYKGDTLKFIYKPLIPEKKTVFYNIEYFY